ncbi:MAG: NAD(P)-dependent oxidoreductase [Pseudomonadota bacterium]
MIKRKVLVTGMGGCIGGAVLRHLDHKYDFTALNRRPMEGVRCVTADIRDFASIRPHFDGQDVVVHLAASLGPDATTKDIIDNNVWGALNVFEAAKQAYVKRVVFASSGTIILNYVLESPWRELESGEYDKLPPSWPMITHESPIRPHGVYGCSKVWGEALGRNYSDNHGMSVICIRFGWVPTNDRPGPIRSFAVWCSHRDAAQMVDKCISAPDSLRFDIFFAVSNNKYNYRDITHARDVIGFEPQDNPDLYR